MVNTAHRIARVSLLEWRRGTGFILAAVLAITGSAMTLLSLSPYTVTGDWSASGSGIVMWVNTLSILLGPLAASGGAWAGGREHRLGVVELLSAVPRRRWHRNTVTTVVLAVAAAAGMLSAAAVTLVSVGPGSAYFGGRWLLSMTVILLGLAAYVAVGFAAGRLLPRKWGAPVVGLGAYLVTGGPSYVDPQLAQLVPVGNLAITDVQQLRLPVIALAVLWLVGIAGTALVAVSARRRVWVLLPTAVAGAAVGSLVMATGADGWTETDPIAVRQVCTSDAPKVCVSWVHQHLLPQITPLARDVLARVPGVSGAVEDNTRVRTQAATTSHQLRIPSLQGAAAPFTGVLHDTAQLRWDMANDLLTGSCPADTGVSSASWSIAMAVVTGRDNDQPTGMHSNELITRLRGDDEAARQWLGRYLTASSSCDSAALTALVNS